MSVYKKALRHKPIDLPSGAPAFVVPVAAAAKHDERCVTYAWIGNRPLFGEVYRRLLPACFQHMPMDSGVMVGTFVRSECILPCLKFPGDVDVLVIPYEGDQLIISSTLAIEIKIIRASYLRQGKSPNQYGFSQAGGLLSAGFPFVAVGHLIISDRSPKEAWRGVEMTKIVDADSGRCAPLKTVSFDMLPVDLIGRSHGRLMRNCTNPLLGHFSAYPRAWGLCFPEAKEALLNPMVSVELMEGVYDFYEKNYRDFLWIRKHPATSPAGRRGWESEAYFEKLIGKMHQDFR